ncbi:hypothetical protein TWF730_001184 [Orbilia blumenaviensis]|uniref:Uncharacterized protein n=1 Tax=Orbilia blumenaviensis TaxID=1796055 RepID=A0AAV9VR12_9PEZI
MQLKNLIVASLAAVGSAAVVQERQIPDELLSLVPSEFRDAIPSDFISQLPSQVQEIYSQVTGIIVPLITALPPSLVSEIESVIETLPESAYPSFFSSVISQLPPDLQSSFINLQASITSQVGGLTSLTDLPATPAPTGTNSQATNTGVTNASETTEGSRTTEAGTTRAVTTGTNTEEPSATGTPNAGSKTFVGLGVMGVAGVLGLAIAL